MKKNPKSGSFGIAGHNCMKTNTTKKEKEEKVVASNKAGKKQALIVTIIILMMTFHDSYSVLFISSSKVL